MVAKNGYRITIDGQVFQPRTLQEALDLFEQAKKLAAKMADEAVPKALPVITINSRELRKAAAATRREIKTTYETAALHAELRELFEISRVHEEDETLSLLM